MWTLLLKAPDNKHNQILSVWAIINACNARYILPYRYTWDSNYRIVTMHILIQSVIQKVNKLVFKTKNLNLKKSQKVRKQGAVASYSEMI